MYRYVVLLLLGVAWAHRTDADGRLPGSWMKDHAQQEDHAYPGDDHWQLVITFHANGMFTWRSTSTGSAQVMDAFVTGSYVTEQHIITFFFDKPGRTATAQIAEWFAFWPSMLKGQLTFVFEDDNLVLANSANKLWLYMKPMLTAEGGQVHSGAPVGHGNE